MERCSGGKPGPDSGLPDAKAGALWSHRSPARGTNLGRGSPGIEGLPGWGEGWGRERLPCKNPLPAGATESGHTERFLALLRNRAEAQDYPRPHQTAHSGQRQ